MHKTVVAIIASCFFISAHAQYYYQDIVSLENTSKNFKKLKANNINTVAVTSIEPDGSETEDFGISQQINSKKNLVITHTRSGITGSSTLMTWFNEQGKPDKLQDSSANTVNDVRYVYDENGRLKQVSSSSHEPEDTNHYTIVEDHVFFYDADGSLLKMLKIKNHYDTLTVLFLPAENGLPGEEQWWNKGRKVESWYYYYDSHGQLTDIVRFNTIAKKMLPDYVFEYDEDGDMSQQTVVQPGTNFYRVWIYEYNDNGLKKAESILKKGKEQEGRIIYSYE